MNRTSHPLLQLTWTRILEFKRDPGAVFWTFGFPIILAVALGVAFHESPVPEVRVAVVGGARADDMARTLQAAESVRARTLTPQAAQDALRAGTIDLVAVMDTAQGPITYRYDAKRPESRWARVTIDGLLQRDAGRTDPLPTYDDTTSRPGGRYIDFLIPGLVGLNIMSSAIWGMGFSIVEARKGKRLKRLAATPMRRSHFLLSYMLSRFIFLVAEVVTLIGFGWLVFDVHVYGSVIALGLLAFVGALSMSGIALLIAARPRSVEVASGLSNVFMLPMWLLSGAFFASDRFPDIMQPIIRILPLTALIDALRTLMTDPTADLATIAMELVVLTLWGMGAFVFALRLFRWQ